MSEHDSKLPLRRGQAVRLDAVIHADPNPDLGLVTVNLERMEVDEALGPYRRSKIVTVPLDIVHDPQQSKASVTDEMVERSADAGRLMKPVTLWHFWKGDEGLVFNHLEDGHSEAEKPTPKFESQNGWNGYRWEKEHAYLDDDNKVIDKETALVRAALLLRKAREKELMGTYRQKRSGLIVDVVEVRPVWNQYQNQYINMVHYVSRRGASVNKAAESWFLEAYVKET